MFQLFLFLLALVQAVPAAAQSASFDIRLAGATLGQVEVSRHSSGAALATTMNRTPMGVGDGRFDASFTGGAYRSLGTSSNETRRIDIDFDGPQVVRVDIDPTSESTPASDASTVPANVLDPARGFARLALAHDCVGAFALYDGRRVTRVTPKARELTEDTLSCTYDYRVTGGPGHLSPFRFRKVSMTARFDAQDGAPGPLRNIALRAGPFTVRLVQK